MESENKTYKERNADLYTEKIKDEINYCCKTNFTGNLDLRINFKEGKIGNMNESVNQSFKF